MSKKNIKPKTSDDKLPKQLSINSQRQENPPPPTQKIELINVRKQESKKNI